MTQAALDTLDASAQTLRKAIESGDADRIGEAMSHFAAAVETVRGIGAWRPSPELKDKLQNLLARLGSDQQLSRLLGDLTGQQLDRLAGTTAAATAPVTYGRKR